MGKYKTASYSTRISPEGVEKITLYPHGTCTAYRYGCRCKPCARAWSIYYQAWQQTRETLLEEKTT